MVEDNRMASLTKEPWNDKPAPAAAPLTDYYVNRNWNLKPVAAGEVVDADTITHALLIDTRAALQSIRRMMIFFTTLAVVGIVVAVLVAVTR
jgi:hypothetical protein